MEKLKRLLTLCKYRVTVQVNDHRNSYQSVGEYLAMIESNGCPLNILPEVRDKMIETDTDEVGGK